MKNKILISCLILFLFLFNCKNTYDFLININNETDKDISGLKISYEMITKEIEVPGIKSKNKIQLKIKPAEKFGENTLILKYSDYNGNSHEEILLGYFEKGYKAEIDIRILKIDKDGIIKFKIMENTSIY